MDANNSSNSRCEFKKLLAAGSFFYFCRMTTNSMLVFVVLLGVSFAVPDKESCRNVVYHVQTLQQVGRPKVMHLDKFGTMVFQALTSK